MLTSNLDFASWTDVFGDPRLTTALLDRITHRCHIIEFKGDSYPVQGESPENGEGRVLTGLAPLARCSVLRGSVSLWNNQLGGKWTRTGGCPPTIPRPPVRAPGGGAFSIIALGDFSVDKHTSYD